MNRRNFFGLCTAGMVGAIASKIMPDIPETPDKEEKTVYTKGLLAHLSENNKTYYTSAYSSADFDEYYAELRATADEYMLKMIDDELWQIMM